MIETEAELRQAFEQVTRLYSLRDRILADVTGLAQTREEEAISITGLIEKIERQIADFVSARPERAA